MRMEHLRQVRAHAHALAGGKEDDQKGSFGHGALLIGARRVALPSVPACWDYATIMPGPRKTARFCERYRAKTGLTAGSTLAQQCYGIRSTCPQPGQPAPVPYVDRAPPNLRPFHYDSICAVRRAFAQQRLNLERGRARPWLRIPISLPAPGGSSRSIWRPGRCWRWGRLAIWRLLAFHPQQAAQTRPQVAEPDPGQAIRALAKTTVEMGTMRRNLSDIQKDVADLKEAAAERETKDKVVIDAPDQRSRNGWRPLHASSRSRPMHRRKAKISERHQRKTGPDRPRHHGAARCVRRLRLARWLRRSRMTALPCRSRREASRRRRR